MITDICKVIDKDLARGCTTPASRAFKGRVEDEKSMYTYRFTPLPRWEDVTPAYRQECRRKWKEKMVKEGLDYEGDEEEEDES